MLEILSPVGDRDTLEAAVRSGADAVYMGMREFNARRNAKNFDREGFAEAVAYCRVRGVRVYLTLNTLLSDRELGSAVDTAAFARVCGVDGVIVQDLGLAALLRKTLPDLPLHASTQLTVHSPSALPVLKALGFEQVVVSREMSKPELAEFCRKAGELDIRVEAFVHGALCMSMSGQCYMSAFLGGRSGNRGLCAGPCRLPFTVKGGTGFDLSLKDLSLVGYISELEEMGVSCLKIEGRMKTPEYVAAATAVCRRTADGEDCSDIKEILAGVFSRGGFTDGYYRQRLGRNMFGVRSSTDLAATAEVSSGLHALYRRERQSVGLRATLRIGELAELTVSDGANTVTKTAPSAEGELKTEELRARLCRTGGTPYYFERLDIDAAKGRSIPFSEAAALRKSALEALSELRSVGRKPVNTDLVLPKYPPRRGKTPLLIGRFASVEQMCGDLSGLSGIVLPLEEVERLPKTDLPLAVEIPRGMSNEGRIKELLSKASQYGVKWAVCGNIAAVELAKGAGLRPVGDFSMNIFNSAAVRTAHELGLEALTASVELRASEMSALGSDIPLGAVVYGRLPLMLTRNCPIKNGLGCAACGKKRYLTDRKGVSFPVRCREGYSEVFNSCPIRMEDKLQSLGADYGVLYFTLESSEECRAVIDGYINGVAPTGEFTRGLYFRGVE
ncbi:MAG: U32 family peptidase [Clostridia bacterium]|nr:U32 family peptidase [Clostridia bacterium]